MALGIDYFKAIHNAAGAQSALEAKVAGKKRRIAAEMLTSINLEENALRNGSPQRFIAVPQKEAYKYTVIAFPDEDLYPGDLLEFRGRKWMVIEVPSVAVLQFTGVVWECNHLFRFQNFNSTIIERWGVLDSGNYSTDIEDGMQVSTTNSQYKMYMQLDEETKKIFVDKRFATDVIYDQSGNRILDVYNITDIDGVSHSYGGGHLLILRAKSGAYNQEKDSLDLMLCDYKRPGDESVTPPPPPPVGLLPCSISGKSTIRCGMKRTYTATFYLADGTTEDSSVTALWTVTPPAGYESAVTWQANGNFIELEVADNEAIAGQIIALSVADQNGTYTPSEFRVEVTGAYG